MTSAIYEIPQDVERILRAKFWSDKGQWVEVVKAAVASRGGCTDDYPKSSGGFRAWDGGTARMRQIFRREGWVKGDEDGVETIVNHDLKVRIAILSTDSGTAERTKSPRNRTRKGPAAEKLTDLNDQFEMFNPREVGAKEPEGYPLWYLCVFDDGKSVRAELSRPIEFKSSFFEKFAERIFIVADDDWSKIAVSAPSEPDAPEFDIKVQRR